MKHLQYFAANLVLLSFAVCLIFATSGAACGGPPNYCANSTRQLVPETPMAPPPVNTPFRDPDFGSKMVRVTNANTLAGVGYWGNYLVGIGYHTDSSGEQNEWSVFDPSIGKNGGYRFWVDGTGGVAVPFEMDATTMAVTRLTGHPGSYLGVSGTLPLTGSFSYTNPDIIYGIDGTELKEYDFATDSTTPLYNFTQCPHIPSSLVQGGLWYGGLTISGNDTTFSYPLGGNGQNEGAGVVVYNRSAYNGTGACYWYDTETGMVGGTNMPAVPVTTGAGAGGPAGGGYTVHDSRMSKSGEMVRVGPPSNTEYFWVPGTKTVTACIPGPSSNRNVAGYCGGHEAMGYKRVVNATGYFDDMGIVIHSFSNLSGWSLLVSPTPNPPEWTESSHWSWSDASLATAMPVCGSTYVDALVQGGDGTQNVQTNPVLQIHRAWDREIVCISTSGSSTVWRFAHDRATGASNDNAPINSAFWSTPIGNVSPDGKFYIFGTDWDWSLGSEQGSYGCPASGTCRTDVFIVELQ
ncbi:MAG TPA: hypothetical protein VMI06_10935 [Terriglobia bacterium]|nr:hypothetical protein [Terriglobia bacterium]